MLSSSLMIESNIAFARGGDVVFLEQNAPAPFKGILFTNEKALDMEKQLKECDDLQLQIDSFNKSIALYKANETLYDNKISLLVDQNGKLINNLNSSHELSKWENAGWFILGMIAISGGLYLGRRM